MAHEHMADLLDLDAEVLSEYHREVAEWVSANLSERARVIDVGAGTGTGSLTLARQLPDAEVIALDLDEEMLKRIQDKASASGLADRIRTVHADLDQAWPDGLKTADLVWAANSLHHMGDPARAVAQIYQMLRPGGLLAVTELESFPRFLTDTPDAALEERIHTAMARGRDEAGMHMHEDWPARFAEAGFAVESERRFVIALQPPPDSPMAASVTRYAVVTLCRARHGLEDKLSASEIAELDALAPALSARHDLTVRTSRTVWLARKPAGQDQLPVPATEATTG
jgi:ubiquinone/menaquinone biosynthesis C-methylase UbiE